MVKLPGFQNKLYIFKAREKSSSYSMSIKTAKAVIALLLLGGLAIVPKGEISHQVGKNTKVLYGGYCISNHMYPDMIR